MKIYFLQKSFLKASEFVKYYTNLTSGDQDNPLPFGTVVVISYNKRGMYLYLCKASFNQDQESS